MKKIALVLTGGTIGSAVENNTISIGNNTIYQLIQAYGATYGETDSFDVFSPFQELSENFGPIQWQRLYDFLKTFPYEQYSGVIIAHGTDTLAYTAALVGLLFAHAPCPITLIASNYPIGMPKSNGVTNLRGAVRFLEQQVAAGVFVIYENDRNEVEVHLATRLLPADNICDQYASAGGACFGKMTGADFSFELVASPYNPQVEQLKKPHKPVFHQNIKFQTDVLFLMPYPGQNYGYLNLEGNLGAVYQYLYHAGTICTKEGTGSFLEFAGRCEKKQIPLYVASVKQNCKNQYITQKLLAKEKIRVLHDISPVAGYMKLVLAYNQTEYSVEELLRQNIFYERVELENSSVRSE